MTKVEVRVVDANDAAYVVYVRAQGVHEHNDGWILSYA